MAVWKHRSRTLAALALLTAAAAAAQSNHLTIDASVPPPAPQPIQATLGTARNPAGTVLGANSQYLTRDGRPWLPVMGEVHYSRLPRARWEETILQMKSAGVDIISSYVIWIHHEQHQGHFDWTGSNDLRAFAQLCAKHGMYFYPRIGPWAHAEVRNGGLPDWVLASSPNRRDDPTYLAEVQTFYHQIALQLHGLYWKDGGPIIGLQIENEYRATGPGAGADHIRTLKKMAITEGMDVPFYTVTGWDGAAIPLDAVLPVFGGYPDAPWGDSLQPMPPAEIYSFRFDNRAAGSMGAIGGSGQSPASVYRGTPFLTAEIGGGTEDTYFRRPVVTTDAIAAIAPVMLGSGVNLLGYYMFRGGRNPDGHGLRLEESQRTGYPTDVPQISYDFQAPIDNNGGERESLRRLKLVHYFLNDFGQTLAPMAPYRPDRMPSAPEELSIPRIAARASAQSAFVFFNNQTRGGVMPQQKQFSVTLKLPGHTLTLPTQPITLPSGAYGIWPVNQQFGTLHVDYSTAQLFKHLVRGSQEYFFFFAIPGIDPEFLLPAATPLPTLTHFTGQPVSKGRLLKADGPQGEIALTQGTATTHLVLLSREKAEQIWKLDDPTVLASTPADFFSSAKDLTLHQLSDPAFTLGLFGAIPAEPALKAGGADGLFHCFSVRVPPASLRLTTRPARPAGSRPAPRMAPATTGRRSIVLAPEDRDFDSAAQWTLTLHGATNAASVSDWILAIRYTGDVAHLTQGTRLLDDNFWNGSPWTISLNDVRTHDDIPLTLSILPLPAAWPIFLEPGTLPSKGAATPAHLQSVQALPRYSLELQLQTEPAKH